jgi:RNA polymerase sigma-70 factor, ECF subfamily
MQFSVRVGASVLPTLRVLRLSEPVVSQQNAESGFDPDGAAEAAFREFRGHVYRFLMRRSRNHHDAEELTQRVFVDAVVALRESTTAPRSMLAWLYTVAGRRFADEARRRAAAGRIVALSPAPEGLDAIYGPAAAKAIRHSIAKLPKDQRTVVAMKVLQGRSFAEIAESTGVSVEACRMRLSRAVASLRVDLERQGFGRDD